MVLDILRASTFNLGLGFKFCLRGKCLRRLAVLLGEVCGFGAQGGFTFQVSTPKALQPPKNATKPQSPNSPKMSETPRKPRESSSSSVKSAMGGEGFLGAASSAVLKREPLGVSIRLPLRAPLKRSIRILCGSL